MVLPKFKFQIVQSLDSAISYIDKTKVDLAYIKNNFSSYLNFFSQ